MEIVINHLACAAQGRISVAGLFLPDQQTHIRPCPPADLSFAIDMFVERGGPFAVGAVINITEPQWHPQRPHIEDHIVKQGSLSHSGRMDARAFWRILDANAQNNLGAIFGPELRASGTNFTWRIVDENKGLVSLGLLRVKKDALLTVDNGLRFWLTESCARACLLVTDLRLHYDDGAIRYDLAEVIAERLATDKPCILSVGLTRAYSPNGRERYHFVQVNNIFFEDDPLGDTWFSH